MHYFADKISSHCVLKRANSQAIRAATLKKLAALSAAAACLLLPVCSFSGETRIYDGDASMLRNIGNYGNSFGPQNLDNVSENQIFVTTGDIGSVFGAYGEKKGSAVQNNSVEILNGNIANVFGGSAREGDVSKNKVSILRGSVRGDTVGGYSYLNNANENIVKIKSTLGVQLGNVYGGRSGKGDASGNKIEIDGEKTVVNKDIRGGYGGGATSRNEITIKNGEIKKDVVGGYNGSVASSNRIQISGGKIGGEITSGYSFSGEASKNILEISGGEIDNKNRIQSGFSITSNAIENKVKISGGKITSSENIYAGQSREAKANDNVVEISNAKIDVKNIYGGYSGSTFFGKAKGKEALNNTVKISSGTVKSDSIYGGYSFNDKANGNRVEISGGEIRVGLIAGGYSLGKESTAAVKEAVNNVVSIKSRPDLSGTSIYGGYSQSSASGDLFSGNTFNLHSSGANINNLKIKHLGNFQYLNFEIFSGVKNGDTLLTINGTSDVDLRRSSVKYSFVNSQGLNFNVGDRINLIHAPNANVLRPSDRENYKQVEVMAGVSKIYKFELKDDATQPRHLYIQAVGSATQPSSPNTPAPYVENPKTKSFLESNLAATAFIDQGGDLIASGGIKSMMQASGDGTGSFVSLGSSDIRYETGSHVDVRGINALAGVSNNRDDFIYGAFVEAGFGQYDSYNSFGSAGVAKGNGDSKYYGAGVMLHGELADKFYAEASARIGKNKTDYSSGDFNGVAKFDISRTYYGAHVGLGRLFDATDRSKIDLYAKAFYLRLGGKSVQVRGDALSFDAVNSLRAKAGARYVCGVSDSAEIYIGGAFEREFGGDAKGFNYALNKNIRSPSLKGNSGIFEAGTSAAVTDRLTLGADVQGYVGLKRGISGGIRAEYKF